MVIHESERSGSLFREINSGKKQSLFREVNERLNETGERSKSMSYADDAICECANDECSERISLPVDEYERIRAHSAWFAVLAGDDHVFPDVERIVEKHDGYWIVEKLDGAAAVADKLDPRQRERPA